MIRRDTMGAMFVQLPGNSTFLRVASVSISDIQSDGEVSSSGGVLRRSASLGNSLSISASGQIGTAPLTLIADGRPFDAVVVYGNRDAAALVESLEQLDGAIAMRNCAIGSMSRSNVLAAENSPGAPMTIEMSAVAAEITEVQLGALSPMLSVGGDETVVAVDAYGGKVAALAVANAGAGKYQVNLYLYDGAEWRPLSVGEYTPLSEPTSYRVAWCHDGKQVLVVCQRGLVYLAVSLVDLDGRITAVRTPSAEVLSVRHGRHLYVGFSNGVVSRMEGRRLVQVANAPTGTYTAMALSSSGDGFVFCSETGITVLDAYNRPSTQAAPAAGSALLDIRLGEASGAAIDRNGKVYLKDSKSSPWRTAATITGGGSSPVVVAAQISWPLMVVSVEVAATPATTTVNTGTAPPFFTEKATAIMASLDGAHWVEVPHFDRKLPEDRGPIFAVSVAGGKVVVGGMRRWPMGAARLLKFDGAVLSA